MLTNNKIKWGFIGSGAICIKLIEDMLYFVPDAYPAAVFSRRLESAWAFASKYGIPAAYDSIDKFIKEADIDVVYIGTPNETHYEYAKKCLNNKINVLCEKPLTVTSEQARELKRCARENNCFFLEAMWTRMFPITKQVKSWIKEEKIGEIVGFNGIISSYTGDRKADDRLFKIETAGGCLLDLGVYQVSYISMLLGRQPDEVYAVSNFGSHGTDDTTGILLKYGDAIASLFVSFRSKMIGKMTIFGTKGVIEVENQFWKPRKAVCIHGTQFEEIVDNFEGIGYQYEIEHVHECLREKKVESELLSFEESIAIVETLEKIRAACKIAFPEELLKL